MINVRITAACHALVTEAARIKGVSIVEYLTRVASEGAVADIEAEERRLKAIREREWPKADG